MSIKGIGISLSVEYPLSGLAQRLAFVRDAGADYVEFLFPSLIHNGQLQARMLERVLPLVRDTGLRYTVHAPMTIDGFDLGEATLHQQNLEATQQFAQAIGAELIVVHAGLQLEKYSAHALTELKAAERNLIGDAASRYPAIVLALENMLPITNLGGTRGSPYWYASRPLEVLEQVQQINLPNVGMCLDTGHALIACRFYGLEYLPTVQAVAPVVAHIHMADNFGKAALNWSMGYSDQLNFGVHDLHLPIGWGAVPFEAIFRSTLFPRNPVAMVEINRMWFEDVTPEIMNTVRQLAELNTTVEA